MYPPAPSRTLVQTPIQPIYCLASALPTISASLTNPAPAPSLRRVNPNRPIPIPILQASLENPERIRSLQDIKDANDVGVRMAAIPKVPP